ncbi:hypothetical protein ACS0TY_029875 [Phlomoides rotata]
MAFRTNSMQGYWKSMANALRTNSNTFTTSTLPKLKAYASPAERPSSGINLCEGRLLSVDGVGGDDLSVGEFWGVHGMASGR